jgi:hypothetical protein
MHKDLIPSEKALLTSEMLILYRRRERMKMMSSIPLFL